MGAPGQGGSRRTPFAFLVRPRGPWTRRAVTLVVTLVTLATVPRALAGRHAHAWFDHDVAAQEALAHGIVVRAKHARGPVLYRSGAPRFDGQSAVAFHQMALLGFGQIVLAHPETRARHVAAMRAHAEAMVSSDVLAYSNVYYAPKALPAGATSGHAYLGYVNMGLAMLRLVDPDHPLSKVNERMTEAFARQLEASKTGLVETYPNESWPPDVLAVAASVGLTDTVTRVLRGEPPKVDPSTRPWLDAWVKRFEACSVDPGSGLLQQRLASNSCKPVDAPRGSGTAVGSYFASFVDTGLSRRLYDGLVRSARRGAVGFAAMREYAPGILGEGDTNAGPMVLGFSVGATGFAVGAAAANGDRDGFVSLVRTTRMFGAPMTLTDDSEVRTSFAMGGALGDALLFAMLTARSP